MAPTSNVAAINESANSARFGANVAGEFATRSMVHIVSKSLYIPDRRLS
jgi:hypothetical protein